MTAPQMSPEDFERIRSRIRDLCGIVVQNHKRAMVQSRILDRVAALGFDSFSAYLDLVDQSDGHPEQEHFCNALTTNLTSFFRENHHYEHFSDEMAKIEDLTGDRVRIWSAGCSTGEEAYSIAMLLSGTGILNIKPDTKILATDIDTKVLRTAKAATYDRSNLSQIPKRLIEPIVEVDANSFEFDASIKQLISFKRLNLLQPWPMTGPFDFIFCRNVMIYFSADVKARLISRFANKLRPGGVLYLGHSETVLGDHAMLQNEGNTIYRRRSYK